MISIQNSTDVEFLECPIRNRERGAGQQVSDVVITIEPLPANIGSTSDIYERLN